MEPMGYLYYSRNSKPSPVRKLSPSLKKIGNQKKKMLTLLTPHASSSSSPPTFQTLYSPGAVSRVGLSSYAKPTTLPLKNCSRLISTSSASPSTKTVVVCNGKKGNRRRSFGGIPFWPASLRRKEIEIRAAPDFSTRCLGCYKSACACLLLAKGLRRNCLPLDIVHAR